MALLTAAEAKMQLPSLTGTGEDTLLNTLIAAVGAAFARWCGYPPPTPGAVPTMETATYTRYLDTYGGRDLVLDVWPVQSVTSVYDDPTGDFTDAVYLVASTDYAVIDGRVLRLKTTASHGAWTKAKGAAKVVYVAGFATVDDGLKHLARLAVRHWFDLRAVQGKASSSQNGNSISFRDEDFLPPVVRQGLGEFRLPRVYL